MTSSNLWPDGNDSKLLIAVANYLKSLSCHSKLNDDQKEALTIATETLRELLPNKEEPGFNLTDIYQSYCQSSQTTPVSGSSNVHAANQTKTDKFHQFVDVLKKNNFFAGTTPGSAQYKERLDAARQKYNTKFPNLAIDDLETVAPKGLIPGTPEAKEMANKIKNEGNALLGSKAFEKAAEKYTEAIALDPENAIFYGNRAAALSYVKKYKEAASDALKATEIDPNYTKAWIRLGLAYYELRDYSKAKDAYQQVLNRTPVTDSNWETYQERVTLCQQKLDIASGNAREPGSGDGRSEGMPDLSALQDMFGGGGAGGGGAGGMADMIKNMGGMDKLLQNPMIQQMANQMMQNPDMMNKMGDIMKNPDAVDQAKQFMNSTGGDSSQPVNKTLMDLMQDPVKAREVMTKCQMDPEFIELSRENPELNEVVSGIQNKDMSKMVPLLSKPDLLQKLKEIVLKYL